jgi:ABC-type nitrate/sulfonate/bicarbonate transport system substrate-binding protein
MIFLGQEGGAVDKIHVNTFGRSVLHETAVKEGIYAAEDMEVEHAVTQSSKAQMQELKDGAWDIVHTNADNVLFWNEDNGADFLIILASPGEAGQDFVVRPEIQSYEQLRGKALAVDAAESGYATPLRMLLGEAGLKQEGRDYAYLEVGAGGARVDALRDGRAYGAMLATSQAAGLKAEGFRILDSINRLYTRYASAAAVRRQWAQERSELLVRYLRTVIRSGQSGGASDGRGAEGFEWDGLAEMMQMRRDLGMLRGPADPRRFADDSYYNRAVESLRASGRPVA